MTRAEKGLHFVGVVTFRLTERCNRNPSGKCQGTSRPLADPGPAKSTTDC
jgi:hypothetical protein